MFGMKSSENILKKIPSLAKEYEEYVKDCRRSIHRFAELGGKEEKTSAFIENEAQKLGLKTEKVSATGLLVTLDTNKQGIGVALRADMDALPVKENENNLRLKRSVVSDDQNTCHACGHDAHSAMLLGAMQILTRLKDSLSGNIYFCFEEGEEVGSGWDGMIEALAAKKVNTVFALHVYANLDSGFLSLEEGPRMAGTINVNATFKGKGGHGSRPDLSVNPLFAACSAVSSLPIAFVNQLDCEKTITCGITSISGSNTNNIIPDESNVLGTLRFFDIEEGKKAVRVLHNVFNHAAAMNRCTVDYFMSDIVLQPVINDKDAVKLAKEAIKDNLINAKLSEVDKWYASESFSQYLLRYKGVLGFLGIRNPEKGCGAEHHNECFDVDEDVLINGVIAHASYAIAALFDKDVANWQSREVEDYEYEEEEIVQVPVKNETIVETTETKETKPAVRPNAKYNLDTKIGVLLKSEAAKQAVASTISGLVDHPLIGFAKGMSIRKAAKNLPSVLTPEVLAKLEEILSYVDD